MSDEGSGAYKRPHKTLVESLRRLFAKAGMVPTHHEKGWDDSVSCSTLHY